MTTTITRMSATFNTPDAVNNRRHLLIESGILLLAIVTTAEEYATAQLQPWQSG